MKDSLYYTFTEQNPLPKIFGIPYPHDHICLKLSSETLSLSDGRTVIDYNLNIYPCSKDMVYNGQQLWSFDLSPMRAITVSLCLAQADTADARAALMDVIEENAKQIIGIYIGMYEKRLHSSIIIPQIRYELQEYFSQNILPLRDLILSYKNKQ